MRLDLIDDLGVPVDLHPGMVASVRIAPRALPPETTVGHCRSVPSRPASAPSGNQLDGSIGSVVNPALPYPAEPLSDERFVLRPWRESDLGCIREASSDPQIPRGTTVPTVFSSNEGIAFIHRQWSRANDGAGVSQAIVDGDSGQAIGLIIVSMRPQRHVAGLGYWVIPSKRARGAATAAVRLITPWSFDALDLQRLEAWVALENEVSQRVLVNAGYLQEGHLRNFLSVNGRASDALVFSAIPS